MPGIIRPALPHEAGALTELILRSKAHWGYDTEFMTLNRPALTLTADRIAEHEVHVYETGDAALGIYDLQILATHADVELLFVAPEAIGTGVGRALWQHMVERARQRGISRLTIESDPFARGFYEAMGARLIGDVPSSVISGRRLPLLEYAIVPAPSPGRS